ncbi:PEBP-like protein [Hanseniaspora valbyensis NRRL Y-1626]|uniref:PEBP-like protein n=1 Tax=Hanseniaspora valbyensis NRRL Y-1626 TaxID=766949 RepID=A0A1B7TCC9_9ASCO|nr:PEBP-like protein [Hanseniaspora valbyensis NRRL Y-1626]
MDNIEKVFTQTFAKTKDATIPNGTFSIIFPSTNKTAHYGTQLKASDCKSLPLVEVEIPSTSIAKKYTLIMTDIDASAEGCHYLTTNLQPTPSTKKENLIIKNYDSENIVDILPYVPPGPRIEQNHAYVWLLFEGVPEMEHALKVRDCRRGYGMNEKGFGAEWFKKVSGLGDLLAFDYHYVKNDAA